MNPAKVNEYDYINFLIATQKAYSCLEAERVQPNGGNSPTHDAITRLLHRMEPLPEVLWRVVLQKLVEDRKLFGKGISYAATPNISAMNLIMNLIRLCCKIFLNCKDP